MESHYGISAAVPREVKNNLPQHPTLLNIYPKDSISDYGDTYSSMFITALFITARNWKHPKCPPIDEWIMER